LDDQLLDAEITVIISGPNIRDALRYVMSDEVISIGLKEAKGAGLSSPSLSNYGPAIACNAAGDPLSLQDMGVINENEKKRYYYKRVLVYRGRV
jgi:hypothetical protein